MQYRRQPATRPLPIYINDDVLNDVLGEQE